MFTSLAEEMMITSVFAEFAQAGQQSQPVLLLHVDIQQHQIDADAGVGQQGARLRVATVAWQ